MDFTQEEFFQALTKYHNAIWPMPWILFFIGIGALAALLSRWHLRRSIILGALSFLWLWCGTIFLGYFCSGHISHTTLRSASLFVFLTRHIVHDNRGQVERMLGLRFQ